jgi:hypothetical protein
MLRKTVLFAGGLLVGALLGIVGTHFFLRHHVLGPEVKGVLRPRMTMSEIEGLFGQPDRTEVIDGKIDGKYEHPKQIIWTYSRYKITESGEQYGQPGHIRFIPVRFLEKDSHEDDEIARKYGEQSDVFRVCSFSGSFPIAKKDWEADNETAAGLFDGFPVKELKK